MRRTTCTLLTLSFLFVVRLALAERPTVVVFPLSPEAVSARTARLVTERIRHGLSQSGRVRVLEREQINRILETIGRNLDDCTEEGCGIEIGRQLDAEKIVVGEIVSVGDRITVLANYVDIATTEREISATLDLDDTPEEQVTDHIPDLLNQLLARIPIEGRLLQLSGDTALVDLDEEIGVPVGAELAVEIRRETTDPRTGDVMGYIAEQLGRLSLLDYPGQGIARCVVVSSEKPLTSGLIVRPLLNRETPTEQKANVTFNLEPGDVFATVDGVPSGSIPVPPSGRLRMKLNPGIHSVHLSRSGQGEWSESMMLQPGDKTSFDVVFEYDAFTGMALVESTGILIVDSNVDASKVYIDGVERGITPFQAKHIAAGIHTVEVTKPLYSPYKESVEIEANLVTTVQAALSSNTGRLEIVTHPDGAMVEIDGIQRGVTPFVDELHPAGNFTVRLLRSLFKESLRDIEIRPGEVLQVEESLDPAFGSLLVTTIPSGADVIVDGKVRGETPVQQDTILSGSHLVQVKKPLFREVERIVDISDGKQTRVELDLDPHFGEISITSNPGGATVSLESTGDILGTTPLQTRLNPGQYNLILEKDDFVPHKESISLGVGDRSRVQATMQRKRGKLRIFSDPGGAEVYIDGKRRGKAPLVVSNLPTGSRELLLTLKGHASQRLNVEVEFNKETVVEVELSRPVYEAWKKQRSKAIASSVLIPGKGQVDSDQKRGWLYACTYAATIWFAFDSRDRYKKAESNYTKAWDTYRAEKDPTRTGDRYRSAMTELDNMSRHRKNYHNALYAAAGIWTINMIDVILWGGGKPEILGKPVIAGSNVSVGTVRNGIRLQIIF